MNVIVALGIAFQRPDVIDLVSLDEDVVFHQLRADRERQMHKRDFGHRDIGVGRQDYVIN